MTKQELRTFYKTRRLELSSNELEERSQLICENVFKNFQLEEKQISLFLPIERQKEINTYKILEKGMAIGAKIALPKMDDDEFNLKHFQFENHTQLKTNNWGIPEPQFGKLIKNKELDFVFVPLLTLDSTGHRVGYGKGFYDRFLKKCRPDCIFIGLHLFDETNEISDTDSHDIPLHFCITPEKLMRFGR
jgi:5-formyltetrahydrofolate cyclo-ligase